MDHDLWCGRLAAKLHAGVPKVQRISLARLLCQRPEAVAFLEEILAPGRAGRATLDIKDGQILGWAFKPARMRRRVDESVAGAVK